MRDADRRKATLAHQAMERHGVSPTPENFAVWFRYVGGHPMELVEQVERLIRDNRTSDPDVCWDLFCRFIGWSSAPGCSEAPQKLSDAISEAKRYVSAAIADSHSQMSGLGDVAAQAQAGTNPSLMISRLMQELALATARTSELEKKLNCTSDELDVLRESLEQAQRHATTDSLTGLANRRGVDTFIRDAMAAAMRDRSALGLIMMDVDHFKNFNDRFGHAIGDQVLKLLAIVLRDRLRPNDFAGRYGGEELIAVLPGAPLSACEAVAERVRMAIADCSVRRRSTGESLPRITVSLGVAELSSDDTIESFIERCDMALYHAKRSGRNRMATERELTPIQTVA
jgi:diguanylate cyclase